MSIPNNPTMCKCGHPRADHCGCADCNGRCTYCTCSNYEREQSADDEQPLRMLIFCPICHYQHIDAPDEQCDFTLMTDVDAALGNEPRLCQIKKGHERD